MISGWISREALGHPTGSPIAFAIKSVDLFSTVDLPKSDGQCSTLPARTLTPTHTNPGGNLFSTFHSHRLMVYKFQALIVENRRWFLKPPARTYFPDIPALATPHRISQGFQRPIHFTSSALGTWHCASKGLPWERWQNTTTKPRDCNDYKHNKPLQVAFMGRYQYVWRVLWKRRARDTRAAATKGQTRSIFSALKESHLM